MAHMLKFLQLIRVAIFKIMQICTKFSRWVQIWQIMVAITLNYWLGKFVQEVANSQGEM